MIFDNIKLGLECCLVGECKICPFHTIPDGRQCRASLYDNVMEHLAQVDETRRERDELADRVSELEEMIEELEEEE